MPWTDILLGGAAVKMADVAVGYVKARYEHQQKLRAQENEDDRLRFDLDARVLEIQNKLFEDFDKRVAFIREERDELARDLKAAREEIADLRHEREILGRELTQMRELVATMQGQMQALNQQLTVALTAQERAEDALHQMLEEAKASGRR